MTPFELVEPRSLQEALRLLDPADPSVRAGGGCTALMLMMKASVLKLSRLVSLRRIEARYCAIEPAGAEIRIGAQATLSALQHSPLLAAELPVVVRTLRTLANVRVRNVATLGGHLAHADPHMDLPPVLIALGARVVVAGPGGERSIAVEDLSTGYLETTLAPAELITEVYIPRQDGRAAAYMKVTTRAADDWPALGVAFVAEAVDGRVRDPQLVVSAATDRPLRLRAAEALLAGAAIDEPLLARAAEAAVAEADPVGDVHGSAAYKKQLLRVYLGRTIRQALGANA